MPSAALRLPVGGGCRAAGVVPHVERHVRRHSRLVLRRCSLAARVTVLPVEAWPPPRGRRVSAVVSRRRKRGPRGRANGAKRAQGHGEQVHVPAAVRQPEGHSGVGNCDGRVHRATGGWRQLFNRLLGAHTSGPRVAVEQTRVGYAVCRRVGRRQFCSRRAGGQGGPKTPFARLGSGHGRDHADVHRVLLLFPEWWLGHP